MGSAISFSVTHTDGPARVGVVQTPHGSFETPAFCCVGTKASVKGVMPRDLRALGAQVALANTYHLFLQPGEEAVATLGGLHTFMGWDGPLVTDSGGFQVFSLGAGYGKGVSKFEARSAEEGVAIFDEAVASSHGRLAIVDDEGVSFTSHIDGSLHRFTPERSIEIQHTLGADIFFAFDECTSPSAPYDYQKEAMQRTERWAERSLRAHHGNLDAAKKQAIFGVVQGGRYPDLREANARAIGAMDFDGFGIGGSFSKRDLGEALKSAIQALPPEKPRHLLGIGEPEDIFEGIEKGIDMFDCVLPTRLGRTGTIFTLNGKVDVRKAEFARRTDFFSSAPGLEAVSYGYLNHLFRANEMLGPLYASMHNLHFILSLCGDIRKALREDRLPDFRTRFFSTYS